ncbi:hypothetical protein P8C59_003871 [Phyllachora maydis]|uniref:RRM domain-containing protein n=1 Tax=Phyllachora maydis TaxID=1825666 RepID=A0AAD9I141_9PEZI|nr:hypothetical protein P8C59_003871 [Phyllachora maydis]
MDDGKVATDFQKIIENGRERKHAAVLATKIFGTRNRRASAPLKTTFGGSLASRAGVQKRVGSTATGPRGRHGPGAGNVDGEWTHDLHSPHSAPSTPRGESGRNFHQSHRNQNGAPHSSSLAARITGSNPKRAAQVGRGLDGMNGIPTEPAAARATPRQDARASFNTGLTIRGLAGPYVVVAQNFVPGTTAGDIETAFGPHGGEIISCRLVKTHPILVAEIVFRSKEGADRVIATFDNQTADGRVLQVSYKAGGYSPYVETRSAATTNTRNNGNVVDGSNGFDDAMETDTRYTNDSNRTTNGNDSSWDPPRQPRGGGGGGGLYSDSMVKSTERGGQGYEHGHGFGNGRSYGRRRGYLGGAGRVSYIDVLLSAEFLIAGGYGEAAVPRQQMTSEL